MQTTASSDALGALCRLTATRIRAAAVRIYDVTPRGFNLRHSSDALPASTGSRSSASFDTDELASGRPFHVDSETLGTDAVCCIVQPVSAFGQTLGFIAVFDMRPRKIGLTTSSVLTDVASLVAPYLSDSPPADAEVHLFEERTRPPPASNARQRSGSNDQQFHTRASLEELVSDRLISAKGGEVPTLLMLGIDRFAAVNEALGSAAADGVLATTESRLRACLQPDDLLVRFEGVRFALIVDRRPDQIHGLCRRLLDAAARPMTLPTGPISMQASIGCIGLTARSLDGRAWNAPGQMIVHAEAALRRARIEGGNRSEMHDHGQDLLLMEKSRLELDLHAALPAGQLVLHFQPFVDLISGRIAGAEALMRWRHPQRGTILPNAFIPMAESSGLILPIGCWAIRAACRAAVEWPGDMTLAVNISALQFHQTDFVQQVDAALAETGFPAERLELEITETVLMRDISVTAEQLRALMARGIRVALDDFGTGYSALAYLSRLPHHRIKLDKSFVQDVTGSRTAGLIEAVISLARSGRVDITAEGVERPEQLAAVARLGFTHAQGFATGAPRANPTWSATPVPETAVV
jgi:diguanylate cyclase (GGDEF)-like protein